MRLAVILLVVASAHAVGTEATNALPAEVGEDTGTGGFFDALMCAPQALRARLRGAGMLRARGVSILMRLRLVFVILRRCDSAFAPPPA